MDSIDDDVVKYGISSDSISNDGLSDRLRRQLGLFNAIVGWASFFGKILFKIIKVRKKAEVVENKHIPAYKKSINESLGRIESNISLKRNISILFPSISLS